MKRTIFILLLLLFTALATGIPYRKVIYPPENRRYFINELGSGWAEPEYARVNIDGTATYIDSDGSTNMTFTDAVTGTKTLAELLAGQGDMGKSTYDVAEDDFVDGNDTAYAVSWNGNINAPSMNAVYDKIETLGAGAGDISDVGDSTSGAAFTENGTGNILYFEGATADGFETKVQGLDVVADYTVTIPCHKAKMTRDAAQSINSSTITKILFDNEEFDVGGIASVVDANFVIAEAGHYLVTGMVSFPNMDTGEGVLAYIYKNGAAYTSTLGDRSGTNKKVPALVVDVLELAVNDYIELHAYHVEGLAQNTETDADRKARMSVVKLF